METSSPPGILVEIFFPPVTEEEIPEETLTLSHSGAGTNTSLQADQIQDRSVGQTVDRLDQIQDGVDRIHRVQVHRDLGKPGSRFQPEEVHREGKSQRYLASWR